MQNRALSGISRIHCVAMEIIREPTGGTKCLTVVKQLLLWFDSICSFDAFCVKNFEGMIPSAKCQVLWYPNMTIGLIKDCE